MFSRKPLSITFSPKARQDFIDILRYNGNSPAKPCMAFLQFFGKSAGRHHIGLDQGSYPDFHLAQNRLQITGNFGLILPRLISK